MLRQLNLLPLLVIPIATVSFVVSHDIVNFAWLEFGEREVPPPISEAFEIASTNTGKSYAIHVQLPGDYHETTATYPVIYAVAPSPFPEGQARILAPLQKRSRVPDLVVVSISPVGHSRAARWTDDLTLNVHQYLNAEPEGGKASAFVAFFEHELFPKIETQYRVTPGDRCLAGHGVGGLFVVETAFTRPELFAKYLALAPAGQWSNYRAVRMAEEKMRMSFDPNIRMFIAGGSDDTSRYVSAFDGLHKALDTRNRVHFKVRTEMMAGRSHDSVVVPGAQKGLVYLYAD